MKLAYRWVIIGLVFSLFVFVGCTRETSGKKQPVAIKGVLDLRDWDFEKDGVVKLKGEWEFYWEQLLEPDDFKAENQPKNRMFINFPSFWNNIQINDEKLGNYGFATYRIRVLHNQSNEDLAIKLYEINTAYKLYLNEDQLGGAGKVGKSPDESTATWKTEVKAFKSDSHQMDFILQISNFSAGGGAVQRKIVLGQEQDVLDLKKLSMVFAVFLCGIYVAIGFYHLLLFFTRVKEKAFLAIGLAADCFFFYTICWYESFFFELFPDFDWLTFAQIAWLSLILLPLFLAWFCRSIFPSIFSTWVLRSIVAFSAVIAAGILFLPIAKTFNLAKLIFVAEMAISFYSIYVASVALKRKLKGASFVFFGVVAWLFANVCVGLYGLSILETDFSHLGFFLFIMLQSVAVSVRFSNTLKETEMLSSELSVKNTQLLKLDRLKDDFLANTSHELRTPLNGIIGIAESMISREAGETFNQRRRNLSLIISSGRRLSLLVNDILDFSKLRHREISMNLQPVDLYRVIESVLALNRASLHGGDVELINQAESSSSSMILADEARLEQILYNLVSNAIKFTHEGSVIVSAEPHNGQITISVADTGIGIPKDKQDTIFNAFEQIDGAETRKYTGTGLGLTIVKQLVELHKSELIVESEPDKGSKFSFSLPIALDSADKSDLTSLVKVAGQPSDFQHSQLVFSHNQMIGNPELKGLTKLLIVDDDPINVEVICQQLGTEHYSLKVAQNGSQALQMVEQEKPDLILLDVMMPEMSGIEVCQILRRQYHPNHLPIIFLTAKNREIDVIKGLESGGNDYLTKPFFRSELIQRVETHLENMLYQKQSDTLNSFANRIGQYESHQEMLQTAFEQIAQLSLVDEAAMFQVGEQLYSFQLQIDTGKRIISAPSKALLTKLDMGFLVPKAVVVNSVDAYHPLGQLLHPGHYVLICPQHLPDHLLVLYRDLARRPFDESKVPFWVQGMINQIQTTQKNLETLFKDNKLVSVVGQVQPRLFEITHVKSATPTLELYFDSDKRTEYIDGCSLEKLSLYFNESLLLRIHKSFLVNPSKVKSVQKASKSRLLKLELGSGEVIPVGRTYMEKVRQVFANRLK